MMLWSYQAQVHQSFLKTAPGYSKSGDTSFLCYRNLSACVYLVLGVIIGFVYVQGPPRVGPMPLSYLNLVKCLLFPKANVV